MKSVELTNDYLELPKEDTGFLHLPHEKVKPRTVTSLTDYLLHNVFSDARTKQLSEADAANQSMNLLIYRITTMTSAAICYAPIKVTDEQYAMPTIDIQEMTSIGVAMAMLILSVMQNEIMLDTQMEGVKGTQNQKLSASQTKILQIRQQIRKSRYKSPFQKFMKWLSDTWLMKFLNSNYGKAIMFLIGAAVTIASFGSAGPAVIAISSILLTFQAAELILGKSMGELITSSMDDGAAKMALQMSIDIGLMVASMASGGGGAAKADDAIDTATNATELAEKAGKAVQQLKQMANAAEEVTKVTDIAQDVADAAKNINKIANEAVNAAQEVAKAADALSDVLKNGGSAVDIMEKTQDLQKAMQTMTEKTAELQKAMQKLGEAAGDLSEGAAKIAIGNVQKLADEAMDNVQEVQKLGEKVLDSATELTSSVEDVADKVDDTIDTLKNLKEKKVNLEGQLKGLETGSEQYLEVSKQIEDISKQIDDKVAKLKSLMKKMEKMNSEDASSAIDKLQEKVKDQLGEEQLKDITDSMSKFSALKNAARFVVGIKGLEHLSFAQQMISALQKFQQRSQILMQTYQAFYNLAMSEEEARKTAYAAEVEMINSKAQAQQDFYQMLIDNQMADIQSLLSYTKSSFARAAEVIREYGDTNQMIARNLVI